MRADHVQRPRDFPYRFDWACADRQPDHKNRGNPQGRGAGDVSRQRIGGDRIEVFKSQCARARPTGSRLNPNYVARLSERRSAFSISRSCGWKIVPSPVSRPWRAGNIRSSAHVAAEFISVAEEIGLIVDLGIFAMERTARQLATWQRTSRPGGPIFASVNLSSRQLLRQDLIQDLRTVLAGSPSCAARSSSN